MNGMTEYSNKVKKATNLMYNVGVLNGQLVESFKELQAALDELCDLPSDDKTTYKSLCQNLEPVSEGIKMHSELAEQAGEMYTKASVALISVYKITKRLAEVEQQMEDFNDKWGEEGENGD